LCPRATIHPRAATSSKRAAGQGTRWSAAGSLPSSPNPAGSRRSRLRLGGSRGPGEHEQHCSAASAAAVCVAPAPVFPSLQPFSRGLCPLALRSPHLCSIRCKVRMRSSIQTISR
ncbi:hypothetical protein GQ607_005111, partial [Colletotrichum asianum]